MFIHVVLFWLQPGTPEAERAKIEKDANDLLKRIPSVRHLWTGRPAMTPREVVDNSYDIGILVTYDDRAGHDAYQAHELHQKFVANRKPTLKKIVIYDFE